MKSISLTKEDRREIFKYIIPASEDKPQGQHYVYHNDITLVKTNTLYSELLIMYTTLPNSIIDIINECIIEYINIKFKIDTRIITIEIQNYVVILDDDICIITNDDWPMKSIECNYGFQNFRNYNYTFSVREPFDPSDKKSHYTVQYSDINNLQKVMTIYDMELFDDVILIGKLFVDFLYSFK